MTRNGPSKNKKNGKSFSKVNLQMPKKTSSRPRKTPLSGDKTQSKKPDRLSVSQVATITTLNFSSVVQKEERKTKKRG